MSKIMSKAKKINYSTGKKKKSNQSKVKKKKKKSRELRKRIKSEVKVENQQQSDLSTTMNNDDSPGQSQCSLFTTPSNLPIKEEKCSDMKAVVPYNINNVSFVHRSEQILANIQNDFFHHLYESNLILTLPSQSWSIHYTKKPKRSIVFSQITLYNDRNSGYVPHYFKKLVLYEKMAYEIYLYNSKTIDNDFAPIQTVPQLMRILSYLNNLKLCKGGPVINCCDNINLECAYKDKDRWRHNLCTLKLRKAAGVCNLCLSLHAILQKSKTLAKRKNNKTDSRKRKRKRQN
ncbi:PREDICTED: uncharacterized protein LOC107070272 [Polistes dominula]|uniref:Uncharacterized protein LOC107070272 n=1 Tax=Polistes dominula TaxID=743375 RepID=A0ABM1IUB1_POLDO|nr:PREDICTED: uncharacterized protein LOC107070272 [Polistes dominula]